MVISEKKILLIQNELKELEISEKDINENFVTASGKGGQKVNKSSSCVQLTHTPSGLRVSCQKERERESNRWLARRKLCEAYRKEILGERTEKDKKLDKIKKQKKKRKKRAQLKNKEAE
ncbi:MAG: peptide chain release factor-like protein [Chlamydiales bacterium]|nr:peptide chain release factor-like protein [Chlamydiales bacterium]NCF70554.1 peptide chain release factor-like protein [Chlamydiales bacterium]